MTRIAPIKIAIVGLGKIAREQHLPSLADSDEFKLVGIASPHGCLPGVPTFADIHTLLQEVPDIEAVAVCTTPQARFNVAHYALGRGLHVLLEKPPGVTVCEVLRLVELAKRNNCALFASWHSRCAGAVEPARIWLASRKILTVRVIWKEDIRVWHPGQAWIWQAGGLGVFDPGINALSILTRILPGNLAVQDAELSVPENCQTPIAARLELLADHYCVHVEMDFRHTGRQTWDIDIDTESGPLRLSLGGAVIVAQNQPIVTGLVTEYSRVYAHFAHLVRSRQIDVDLAPLQLVADAFLCARRVRIEPYMF